MKYRKGMPLPEMAVKDMKFFVKMILNYLKSGFSFHNIYIYPHYPSSGSTIYKIANVLGYNISNKPRKNHNASVYWEYCTFRSEYNHFDGSHENVVNLFSRDISKVFVDNAFMEVFGYSTFIDPTTYNKPFVKKNDINAKHDGEILFSNEIAIEDGFIYQKLIDNTTDDNTVMDIRVPVVKGALEFVYLKYRDKSIRFTNSTAHTIVKPIEEVFSTEEIDLINRFCKTTHLDFGELDILRDNNDKRIYIVDVNNTPQGPPKNLNRKDSKDSIHKIASAFKRHFL